MANNGGYRDEREAMAARNEELERANSALGAQASQLGLVQRENAELRRRLGEPGAPPVRNRSVLIVVGVMVAAFALACLGGLFFVGMHRSTVSTSAPATMALQPPATLAPAIAPAPIEPTPAVKPSSGPQPR